MAISPPSDIVLDVARAADPVQYSAALEKLQSLGAADPAAFASFLADPASDTGRAAPLAGIADLRGKLGGGLAPGSAVRDAGGAFQKFEAFVLQTFIQSMLPKDAENVFGEGTAGNVWSSMLAEQLAAQLAAAGGIGIAATVASRHPSVEAAALPGLNASLEMAFADALRPGGAEHDGLAGDT